MNKIADIAMGIVVVSAIFVMVRPGSQGPKLVSTIGGAFTGAIKAATGGGTW